MTDTVGRRVLAGVISLIVSGTGHAYRGRLRRGWSWFGLLTVLFVTLPWTGPLGLLAAMVARVVVVPVDAALCRSGEPRPEREVLVAGAAMLVATVAIALGVRLYLVEGFKVPAASMQPTLRIGDHFYIDKLARDPGLGDVIVFRHPYTHRDYVKRVVARGGDRIAVKGGVLYLNGEAVPREPAVPCTLEDHFDHGGGWTFERARCATESLGGHRYSVVVDESSDRDFPPTDDRRLMLDTGPGPMAEVARLPPLDIIDGALLVPAGWLFVMGDWRANSNDSRAWGPVPVANVKGTVMYVWWSTGPDGARWGRLGRTIE